jgi:hypothetical protein
VLRWLHAGGHADRGRNQRLGALARPTC